MQHNWPLLLVTFLLPLLVGFNIQASPTVQKQTTPIRIISLVPSITETLFALQSSSQLVGVSNYCDYPPASQSITKVGRGLNPNLETILKLTPDLVLLSPSGQKTINQLEQLGITTLAIKSQTLDDIRLSIKLIGQATGRQPESALLLAHFDTQINMIEKKVAGQPRPRVMISMGHSAGNNDFQQFYIAGQQDFYNDLIKLAGGINVYQKPIPKVPLISLEGLFHLNPEVIIDVFPEADDHTASIKQVRQQWTELKHISAIKTERLHIIEADYATIPGPRIIKLLTRFAKIIHPNLDWPRDTTY